MKGKVLDFSLQESSGIILGNDGKRYNFLSSEWNSDKSPLINQLVDFTIEEEAALSIYLEKTISSKSKVVAGLLALFLGGLGIHKFYLGCTMSGIMMLVIFVFGFILLGIPSFIIGVIAFIEAILYLTKSDDDFEQIYVQDKKCWF